MSAKNKILQYKDLSKSHRNIDAPYILIKSEIRCEVCNEKTQYLRMFLRRQACGNCYYLIRNDEEGVLRLISKYLTGLN